MNKREEKIIDFYVHDYRDVAMSKEDLKDMLRGFVETLECEHQCTSNCRRVGCNCNCGEYHL